MYGKTGCIRTLDLSRCGPLDIPALIYRIEIIPYPWHTLNLLVSHDLSSSVGTNSSTYRFLSPMPPSYFPSVLILEGTIRAIQHHPSLVSLWGG